MITLEQKKAIVSEVAEVAARAPTAVAAEYIGLNVAEMTDPAGYAVRVYER